MRKDTKKVDLVAGGAIGAGRENGLASI